MAWTVQLTDGTTTRDLNDLSTFWVRPGTFSAPPPAARIASTGATFFRDGSSPQAIAYGNRTVSMALRVYGSSRDNLISAIQDVEELLRKAREYSVDGLGSQVQLAYQWDSATSAVRFNVLHGLFSLGADALSHNQSINTTLMTATLTLVCEPYAVGVSTETLQNYLRDPGFELNDGSTRFVDWTVSNGTRAVETSSPPEGVNWGKVTSNTSSAQCNIYQTRTMTAGNHVFTVQYKINGNQAYEAYISDSGGTTVAALTEDNTQRTATVTRDSSSNTAITAGVRSVSSTSDTDDIILLDKAYLGDGTTAPTAWVSSRELFNHHEDEGKLQQTKVNYIDIEDIPGDSLALLQVASTELEAHTDYWIGARHDARQREAGLWHEGEGFASLDAVTVGSTSSGQVGRANIGVTVNTGGANSSDTTGSITSVTLSHTCSTENNRVLVVGVASMIDSSAGAVPSGVTYNGVAMTKVNDITNEVCVSLWYLINPASGSNNVVVSFGSTQNDVVVGAVDMSSVHQTTAVGSQAESSAASTSASISVAASADDMVVDIAGTRQGGLSVGAGQTQVANDGTDQIIAAMSIEEATGTTTMSWTVGSSVRWAAHGVAIKPLHATSTAASPIVMTKTISSPPDGLYRVLARVASVDSSAWGVAMGYAYGGITSDPSVAGDYTTTSSSAFTILDIGTLTVPPVVTPIGQTAANLTLRLAMYATGAGNDALHVDWVFLMPVDQGFAYCSKTSATDRILSDSMSPLRSLVLLNTSDVVQSVPANQVGSPPMAHPGGTRLYMVSDNGAADIDDGWTVGITYLDRHVHVK